MKLSGKPEIFNQGMGVVASILGCRHKNPLGVVSLSLPEPPESRQVFDKISQKKVHQILRNI